MEHEDFDGDYDDYEHADTAVHEWAVNDFVTMHSRLPTDSEEDEAMMEEIKEYYYDKYCGRYC
jgi:hypothetical protein